MNVIVATTETQGTVEGDYCWTVDGELATPVRVECCDPRCGCGRGFPGLASARATTTVMVADLPHLSLDDLRAAVADSLERDGWFDLVPQTEWHELVDEHVEAIEQITSSFPVGAVLSRDGDRIFARRWSLAA